MWMPPIGVFFKGVIREVTPVFIVAVAIACICAGIFFAIRGCDSDVAGPDYLEDAKKEILDGVAREREENDRKIKELDAELYDLRIRVENLDAEIAESANYREGIHDAIDLAISIDDVDRILRDGIPGVSGR